MYDSCKPFFEGGTQLVDYQEFLYIFSIFVVISFYFCTINKVPTVFCNSNVFVFHNIIIVCVIEAALALHPQIMQSKNDHLNLLSIPHPQKRL